MKQPRLQLSALVRIAISVVILAALVWWTGPAELASQFANAHLGWLAAAVVVNYLQMLIGAFDVVVLTRALEPGMRATAIVRAYLRSWAVGMVAPGKIGDLTYAGFLADAEEGRNYAPGLAVAVVDKIVTFVVTALIAVVGLALYAGSRDALLGIVFAAVATVGAIVTLRSSRVRALVRDRVLGTRAARFAGFSGHLDALLRTHRSALAINAAGTFARTVIAGWATVLALRAFGASAPLGTVVMVNAVSQIATLVPISFSGLGVRQGVSTVMLERLSGVPRGAVVGEQFIMTAVTYMNVALIYAVLGGADREQPA